MANRTTAQLRNHYEVEKELAQRLRRSNREERKALYEVMYDELFDKVPDHPRLLKRANPELTLKKNKNKLKMIRRFLNQDITMAEFAPGDCEFCFYVANRVGRIYGMDISDQTNQAKERPDNFELIIYDGYSLDVPKNSVDLLFSDQFIEHLHPEDVPHHYALARSLLVPGGKYVFRYPHRYRGPSDISRLFSDTPEGFHLNESTFTETVEHLKRAGFFQFQCYWFLRGMRVPLPFWLVRGAERLTKNLPFRLRRLLAHGLFPAVQMSATR